MSNEREFNNEMRGALFLNKRRDPERNHPHKRGRCQIKGVSYYMDAWEKTGRDGQPFMSISFKEITAQPGDSASDSQPRQEARPQPRTDHAAAARAAARGAPPPPHDIDDDIPF